MSESRIARPRVALLAAGWVVATVLSACGGSDDNNNNGNGGSGGGFVATPLVSDSGGAPNTDANLVNAWGVAFNPQGFVWVADNGTARSTLYDGNGVPQSLVVTTPAAPTGIVFNGSTTEFMVTQNAVTGSSAFLFATEGGQIAGWSPTVNRTVTVTVIDGSAASKSYKGLALASQSGASSLYAADFHNGAVDRFDGSFAPVITTGAFTDPNLPAGYAPFGIQAINGSIYVAYAQQDAQAHDAVAGAGLGLIDVYDMAGTLQKRLVTGGALNAPWGMALAPAGFGAFANALLVGNFGDGKINAYDASTGQALGTLSSASGAPIVIDGLWGIAFGNGLSNQPTTTLFYAAGPADESHGLYGRIDPQ